MKRNQGTVPTEPASLRGPNIRRNNTIRNQEHTVTKDILGADILYKPDNVLRIGFKNINRFLNPATNQVKYDVLQAESGEHGFQFDLQSYIETNRRWNRVDPLQHLCELTKGWWERPSYQLGWLRDNDSAQSQYGGIATIATKHLTSCRFKHGVDKIG